MKAKKRYKELSERIFELESATCGTGGCIDCKGYWDELVEVREEFYEIIEEHPEFVEEEL